MGKQQTKPRVTRFCRLEMFLSISAPGSEILSCSSMCWLEGEVQL